MKTHPSSPWFLRDARKFGLSENRMLTVEHESGSLRSVLATVNEAHICPEHGDFLAIARLIAAAPELLAALKKLIAVADKHLPQNTDDAVEMVDALVAARAYIRQAEGRA